MFKSISFIGLLLFCFLNSLVSIAKSDSLNWMPVPAEYQLGNGKFLIKKDFTINVSSGAHKRLYNATDRFLRRLDGRTGLFFTQGVISIQFPQTVSNPKAIVSASKQAKVQLYEDESYKLVITPEKISIDAPTDLGAMHALETLLQLLSADKDGYYFPVISVNDKPRFPWRGIMIDAARHFQPIDVIKRNLDAMAAVKMNVFHFHLCDNHGWRVESKTFSKLHELASDGLYYSQEEIKKIVEYADERGIRVMPEFDVPGHATAFLVAFPELASAPGPYEIERNAGIFDPVLNPTIDQTYVFLDKLFEEMAGLFPDPYFHIGGDENNGAHWKSNKDIQAFMAKNNMKTTMDLQTYFNNRLIKTVQRLNKKMMGWEEILQPGLSKDAIIHSWFGKESLYKAASQGYQTLLSNGFYIDLLQPASDHYINDPLPEFSKWSKEEQKYKLTPDQEKLILGGEATMWSELVTPVTIDSRIWPRCAAIAERLWSPGSVNDVNDMYRRLDVVSRQLEEVGLTHIKNRDMILRNIANSNDIKALQVLADVSEPYKIYTRNRGGLMYKSYSPLTLFADATSSDAPEARKFNVLVDKYLSKPNASDLGKLKSSLTTWKENHKQFLITLNNSPVLSQLTNLSQNLSLVSEIGLQALESKNSTPDWYAKSSDFIKKTKEDTEAKRSNDQTFEDGRTSLVILDAIQSLVDATNKDMAAKRIAKEKEEEAKKKATESAH